MLRHEKEKRESDVENPSYGIASSQQHVTSTSFLTDGLVTEEQKKDKKEQVIAKATQSHEDTENEVNDEKNNQNKDAPKSTIKAFSARQFPGLRSASKSPKETLKAVYAAGKYKAGLRIDVLSIQCFMAGIYIASACQLLISVGGGILGACLFPGGLMAVVFTSAELFTGDALIFVASVLGCQVKFTSLLRNWSVAWCFNFAGSLTWAFFLGYLSNSLVDLNVADVVIATAEKKAHSSLLSIFIRGIGANFMVCVAIWQATCAEELAGKVLAIWFPVMAFVAMSFDHCVANMYFIPMGMMLGANVSVARMFAAIFMATFGNTIGGGVFVGAIYWYVFDSMQSFNVFRARIRQGMHSRQEA